MSWRNDSYCLISCRKALFGHASPVSLSAYMEHEGFLHNAYVEVTIRQMRRGNRRYFTLSLRSHHSSWVLTSLSFPAYQKNPIGIDLAETASERDSAFSLKTLRILTIRYRCKFASRDRRHNQRWDKAVRYTNQRSVPCPNSGNNSRHIFVTD